MRMILAIFDLQITLMLSPKFPSLSTGLWVQEKKHKIDFQDSGHCSHLGFLNGPILAIFHLQVILMLPIKFQLN